MNACRDDLIFDVGMHVGEDTDFYLKKGYRVVGFEANPECVRHCSERFAGAVASGALTIISGAVTSGDALTVPFYVNLVETQWGTLNQDWVERNERRGKPSRRIDVDTVDVVDVMERHGVPAYLKIDIEGSDTDVLSELFRVPTRPQFVSIETNIFRYGAVLAELELLRRLGYSRFRPVQQEHIGRSTVRTRSRDGEFFEHTFGRGATGLFGDDLAGPWLSYEECASAYRSIFARYWLTGHLSLFQRLGWQGLRRRIEAIVGTAGWHDLHARL